MKCKNGRDFLTFTGVSGFSVLRVANKTRKYSLQNKPKQTPQLDLSSHLLSFASTSGVSSHHFLLHEHLQLPTSPSIVARHSSIGCLLMENC
jgi:hypothetical protein